jgi:hypothetical protein
LFYGPYFKVSSPEERERERERERDEYESSGVFQKQSLKVGYKEGSILFL